MNDQLDLLNQTDANAPALRGAITAISRTAISREPIDPPTHCIVCTARPGEPCLPNCESARLHA